MTDIPRVPRPLMVLDIRGFILRAYWTTKRSLQEEDGTLVPSWENGATRFLELYFNDWLGQAAPKDMVAVFDSGNEYRTGVYPGYKESRRKEKEAEKAAHPVTSEQVAKLQEKVEEFLTYLGVKCVRAPGQEADDLISLFAEKISRPIIIHTVDEDLIQLASDNVTVIRDGQVYSSPEDLHEGIPAKLIVLYKSLVGDTSDEYPGVSGFGPAKWADCVAAYGFDGMAQLEEAVKSGDMGAVEAAYRATGDKPLKLILDDARGWSVSYKLAQLNPEVCYGSRRGAPVRPKWNLRIPSRDKVSQLLFQMKAPDLLPVYEPWLPTFTLLDATNTDSLQTAVKEVLGSSDLIAYDFESYDTLNHKPYQQAAKNKNYVDVLSQSITGISFCGGKNYQDNYYVSFNHADTANLSKDWARWLLQSITGSSVPTAAHNAMFEVTVAKQDLGIELPAPLDSQIMQSYVDENEESNLKDLTKSRFRYQQQTYAEVTDGKPMNELSAEHVLSYGCDDSLVTAFHADVQRLIMELEGCHDFYFQKEVNHVTDRSDIFIDGTFIDYPALSKLEKEDRELVEEKAASIRKALELNCMNKPENLRMEHAKSLLDMWWEFEEASLKQGGASAEEMQAKYQTLWEKAWAVSVYTPYSSHVIIPEFIPTAAKINNVFSLLNSDLRVEKVSKKYLSEWLVTHEDEIDSAPSEVREFVSKMASSCHQFPAKKRSGEDYEAFREYAQTLLEKYSDAGKVESDGDELNFGSSPQMIEFLYGKLGLPLRVRSKVTRGSARDQLGLRGAPATGNKASAAAIVYDLQDENDWRRQVVLDYMDIVKARQNISLYYTPYPLWKSPVDGKIHPQIKNCGTVTRRPSGTAPNILQVSAKDGAKIRKAYACPSKDYAYVCLDFNGQELRITASESQDKEMVAAYVGENRKDIHSLTASGFANVILQREGLTEFSSPLSYEQYLQGLNADSTHSAFNLVRKLAKAVNFLIIYGGGYTTLAQNLLIALELAKSMMQNTFSLYSGLEPWQRRVVEFARSHGYVETAYGNRRHLTRDLYSTDDFLRMRQERQAVNATIQGCAADILKVVLSEMRRRRIVQRYGLKSLMPVYDEVASLVPVRAIPDYIEEMKEIMEVTPPGHIVPMEIEADIGLDSWGGKVELGRPSHAEVIEFLTENGRW